MQMFLFFSSFLLYSAAFYFYSTRLYDASKKIQYALATLFNSFFYLYYIFHVSFEYEYLALSILFFLYLVELKIIFRQNWIILVYRSLTLCLHVIAMRMIIIGLAALYYDLQIYELVANQEHRITITTLLFLVTFPYVLLVKFLFDKTHYVQVVKTGRNIQFSIILLSAIFIYCLTSTYLLYPLHFPDDIRISYLVIKIGVCSLLSFFLCLIFDYMFSVLSTHKNRFTSLANAIREGRKDLRKLVEESSVDAFTSLKVREVAYTRINQFLEDDEPFYVIFADMNGLKVVNDTYGHHEGDFYIKQVAETLKQHFSSETIARLGGDEFLIVGKSFAATTAVDKIKQCSDDIFEIAKIHNKEYETSISYGVVMVENKLDFETPDEIIKLADERMYAHKKSLQKARIVVNPYEKK